MVRMVRLILVLLALGGGGLWLADREGLIDAEAWAATVWNRTQGAVATANFSSLQDILTEQDAYYNWRIYAEGEAPLTVAYPGFEAEDAPEDDQAGYAIERQASDGPATVQSLTRADRVRFY